MPRFGLKKQILMLSASYSTFLPMLAVTEIKRMSLTERLRAMELLWDSISESPEQMESPEWHGEVLASRLAKVKAGQGKFLTLPQLKARLNKKRS
jgi:putative addiction module component (TIGR02574 family)